MKKLLSVLCICALALVCVLALPATAQAATEGDYTYELLNGNSVAITGYTGKGGSITIPEVLDIYSVTAIGANAFSGCSDLTDVTIPGEISVIGEGAFADCDNLAEVTIQRSIVTGGNGSSLDFDSLLDALYPTKLSIGKSAFAGCDSLTVVNIDKRVAVIEDSAFSACNGLTAVHYNGTTSKWKEISIGKDNKCLRTAVIYCSDYTHQYEATVTPPGCIKGGYTTYTCECLDSYTADEVSALGHNYVKGSCTRCDDTPEAVKLVVQLRPGYAPVGKSAYTTVKATGDGITYTWYHRDAKASSFSKASTKGDTYGCVITSASNGRYVYCVLTDMYGNSVTTNTVRMWNGNPATITTQLRPGYAPVGKSAYTTVQATGDGITYTWYHRDAKASSFSKASTKSATYGCVISGASNGRYVYCVVTDKYGNTATTNTVRMWNGNPATITTQLRPGYAPVGKSAYTTVQATGDGITYTWYHRDAKASSFSKASTKSATYGCVISGASNGRYVYCVVTDKYGNTATTNTVRMWNGNPATITTQLRPGYAPVGKVAYTTVQATGDGITYTWYHRDAKASSFSKASTKSATYGCVISGASNGRYVYCVVTDKYGNTATTNTVRMWNGNPATIIAQPMNGYASVGKSAYTTVKATGDGITYTWYHKNANASSFVKASTTGATYGCVISGASNGRYVYCVVTDKYGNTATTNTVRMWNK